MTSAFTVGIGLTNGSESNTSTSATVWINGGTVGYTYDVTNHITMVAGRIDDRTFRISINER